MAVAFRRLLAILPSAARAGANGAGATYLSAPFEVGNIEELAIYIDVTAAQAGSTSIDLAIFAVDPTTSKAVVVANATQTLFAAIPATKIVTRDANGDPLFATGGTQYLCRLTIVSAGVETVTAQVTGVGTVHT